MKLDAIGDVHGRLDGLFALVDALGYDRFGRHPAGRRLVFLGDLVDNGPQVLETAEWVRPLVLDGVADCIMGNHEYNLAQWHVGLNPGRKSNTEARADVARRPGRWRPVLEFLCDLPVAIRRPDLRLVHACWHLPAFETLGGLDFEVLEGPFADRTGARTALRIPGIDRAPDAVLVKGPEEDTEPYQDAYDKTRTEQRVLWWQRADQPVPRDELTVFGHYWSLPPVPGLVDAFAPAHPTGRLRHAEWRKTVSPHVERLGVRSVPDDVTAVCIDFTAVEDKECIGAFRWPEREVWWATD